jgi:hypothetical protein
MTAYTNQSKSSSPFVNEPMTGVAFWDDANVGWDDPLFSWDAVKTQWIHGFLNMLTYLLTEAGGYLLLEDGGRIVLTGDSWVNDTKH